MRIPFPINLMSRTGIDAQLRAHGVFPTAQRLAIAQYFLPRHQHLTAEQLHLALHQAGIRVSKATVYNTLGVLVDAGLVREIFIGANRAFFDSNASPHHHLFNLDTGELSDLPNQDLVQWNRVSLPDDTQVESIELVLKVRRK